MNRGIVVEQHKRFTVLIDQNGQFHKAEPMKDVAIGVETSFTPKQISRYQSLLAWNPIQMKLLTMAVIVLLAIFPAYSLLNYNPVYAYVNIDINPSVELALDDNLIVEDIKPLNEDAKLLLQQLSNLEGRSVETVTDSIISKSQELNWVTTMNTVLIGIHYQKNPKENRQVTERIDEYFKQQPKKELKIATFEVSDEVRKAAEDKKVSMNEIMADTLTETEAAADKNVIEKKAKLDANEEELIESYFEESNKLETITKQEKKEKKQEEKETRKQEKQQQKEERKQDKQEQKEDKKQQKTESKNNKPNNEKKENPPKDRENEKILPPGIEKKLDEELKNPVVKEKMEELAPFLDGEMEEIPAEIEEKLEALPPGIRKKLEEYIPQLDVQELIQFNFYH